MESHGAQARRVEQVLGVDDDRPFHEVADPGEIERPEFRPTGGDDQSIHAFGDAVGRFAVLHHAVQLQPRIGHRHRIVSPHTRSPGQQVLRQLKRRRSRNRVGVWLESQAQNADIFVLYTVDRGGHFLHQPVR